MKHIIIKFLKSIFDNQRGQRLLKKVHLMVLYLQNYGLSGDFTTSGELEVIKRIKNHLKSKNNIVLFDVGANVGNYTKFLNQYFDKNRSIFCFEPSVNTFNQLELNTKGIDSIELINKGLGDKDEELTLYSNNISNTQSSVLKRDMSHWDKDYNLTNEEVIQLTTLDDFCKENKIEYIDFLKIDVEGNEMNLFNGSREMLQNGKVGFIQFEFGVASVDGKYFFKDVYYMLIEKYRIYRITSKNLFEIKAYSEQLEVFLTTNYLAISRDVEFIS